MKKQNFSYFLTGLALVMLFTGYALSCEQQALADKLVRLHVVANSDTEVDQSVKLQVRDAVLEMAQPMVESENPVENLSSHLADLEWTANEMLEAVGSEDCAIVTLEKELFPTREYDTFTLPAGTYTSLRVTIGAGEGHNWWCVVYPSLCMPATVEDLEVAALEAGLTDGEIALITEQETGYQLKFKSLEWLEYLKERMETF